MSLQLSQCEKKKKTKEKERKTKQIWDHSDDPHK